MRNNNNKESKRLLAEVVQGLLMSQARKNEVPTEGVSVKEVQVHPINPYSTQITVFYFQRRPRYFRVDVSEMRRGQVKRKEGE